ncbi:hypothetical protein [Mycobacterium sp. 141]|uniref:hypothetical protein n=1 Tax=Mycobacterium sp. 141 TaxID=1120797 RepID=UPI0012DD458D|nr:hypothetical protein [Mycobacterium sp. 141]
MRHGTANVAGAGMALAIAIVGCLAWAPTANADEVSCGELAYPNSRKTGTLMIDAGGPSCDQARAVLNDHFAQVLGGDSIPRLPASSPLRRYHCDTDFTMAGGMRGTTMCKYIVGEGNDADQAMEIVVLPL